MGRVFYIYFNPFAVLSCPRKYLPTGPLFFAEYSVVFSVQILHSIRWQWMNVNKY